jgi:hypothetical protein
VQLAAHPELAPRDQTGEEMSRNDPFCRAAAGVSLGGRNHHKHGFFMSSIPTDILGINVTLRL